MNPVPDVTRAQPPTHRHSSYLEFSGIPSTTPSANFHEPPVQLEAVQEEQQHTVRLRPDARKRNLLYRLSSVNTMRRAFSRREHGEKDASQSMKQELLPKRSINILSRERSVDYGGGLRGVEGNPSNLQRSISKREKIVQVLANPDALFRPDPTSPPPASRFNPNPNGKLIRTFFSNNIDLAPTPAIQPLVSPNGRHFAIPADPEVPLFSSTMISPKVSSEMPANYLIRPLCRSDFHRGYLDCMRVLAKTGHVDQSAWDRRCEWLRSMSETYYVVVILDAEDVVVATGTIMIERKFTYNLASIGHIQDIAVARSQKGKKMGLRILEALLYVSVQSGCIKSVVSCSEANEAFHAQVGFTKEGSQMNLSHSRKEG